MTSPRSYDGVGYPSPSFSSGTPIYDSLVAERGVPQIAPINVPAALPPALPSGYGSAPGYGAPGYGPGAQSFGGQQFGTQSFGAPALPAPAIPSPGLAAPGFGTPGFDSPAGNLPALPPARLALGPGPSSSGPATAYLPAQSAPVPTGYTAAPQPSAPAYGGMQPVVPSQRPMAPVPTPAQSFQPQAGQSFGGQNSFASAPQGFAGQPSGGPGMPGQNGQNGQSFGGQQFGAQGFGGQAQQGFADHSFGGNQFRAAPVAPVRPVQPQRPAQYGEQQYQQAPGQQFANPQAGLQANAY
ncbi:DUF6643 family protein [Saccharothrix sp. ST-888]|uniref:DUF6643 family protein n=1 Tax=Saccharothrix sp. ST-888 TaxID=1427391 RepID=UPI000698837D|nr:DUF6643 family protein [Saccharothrix sp. ST-888]